MHNLFKILLFLFIFVPRLSYAYEITPTMLYIPQDNRPISHSQTVDAIKSTNIKVLTPPENLLGTRENPKGDIKNLQIWLKDNIKKSDIAVISSDALIYGSLVASRKEDHKLDETLNNAKIFTELKEINPHIKIYVFGSIMRTPQSITASGGTDSEIFAKYGNSISKLTALEDKKLQHKLTRKDKKAYLNYKNSIPKEALEKWLDLRYANTEASKKLIHYLNQGFIDYLVLGADDNAEFSQTNIERRQLDALAESLNLNKRKYISVSGIDELGYDLLTRGVNNIKNNIPFVYTYYNKGTGKDTIPSYSNEPIDKSISRHLNIINGLATKMDNADFIFMINTKFDGTTGNANVDNTIKADPQVLNFVEKVEKFLKANKKVVIGDIAFANGSDNALMNLLDEKNFLQKLSGYAGWNTPTNSTGFALAMGSNALLLTSKENMPNLAMRYLDDWLYEANIRQDVASKLYEIDGKGSYMELDEKLLDAEKMASLLLDKKIKAYNLGQKLSIEKLPSAKISFPWNRMFEANISWTN